MFVFKSAKRIDGTAYPDSLETQMLPMWPDFYSSKDQALGNPRPYADAKYGDLLEVVYYDTPRLPVRWWCFWRMWTKPHLPPFIIEWKFQ
jgi:hypothetical protein